MIRIALFVLAASVVACGDDPTAPADTGDGVPPDTTTDGADAPDDSADAPDDGADAPDDGADAPDDSADAPTPDTEVELDAGPDGIGDTVVDVGCVDCAHGCCGDRCCALDPAQALLGDVEGVGDFTTPASLTFDTGGDCKPNSVLGACDHIALEAGMVACLCRLGSLEVPGTLTVTGNDVLIVLAKERIDIAGTLDVSAVGRRSGPGGGWSYAEAARGRAGGLGGSYGTPGGGASEPFGDATLVPLTAGCIGQGTEHEPDIGGGRGGGLQLSAGERITITGSIRAHGGGGGGGRYGGGGGGSGGSILIEAPRVDITGSVKAHGGGGGGAGGSSGDGSPGQDGGDAQVAGGGAGNDGDGCPLYGYVSGGDGGDGAFEDSPASSGQASASDSRCIGSEAWVGGGGGGGGQGRIVINTATGCACVGEISPVPALGDVTFD